MRPDSGPDFWTHLEAARRLLLGLLAVAAVCVLASWAVCDRLLAWLLVPLQQAGAQIAYLSPQEGFLVRLELAACAGLIAASPVALCGLWRFAAPGLFARERRRVAAWAGLCAGAFVAGAGAGAAWVLPRTLAFFLAFDGPPGRALIGVERYVSFAASVVWACAAASLLPVLVLALARTGLVQPAGLGRHRVVIVPGIFILAALITPPDVLSQCVVAVPLWIFFEALVFFHRRRGGPRPPGQDSGSPG